ncbi:ABC transporter permease [Bradyrhizobium denitrificans]|jgi:NitT/TauT family transport system permease protein
MRNNAAVSHRWIGENLTPSPLIVARATVAVLLVAVWFAGAQTHPMLIATPQATVQRVIDLIAHGELAPMVGTTAAESFAGLAVGAGLGMTLPFLVQMSARLQAVIEPFARAAVGVPKLALSPILILWFGIGLGAKVVLVALMTFFLVFVATAAGIRSIGPNLMLTVAVFGASKLELAREVIWNSVQPFVWAALRAALPWAINAALVGEFLAAENGVGHYIDQSYNSADIAGVYAGISVIAALVFVSDAALMAVQRRCLGWRPVDRDAVLH